MHGPEITHRGPSTGRFLYWVGRLWMWLAGWDTEGEPPPEVEKAVLIAAPHTTNWDLFHMLAAAWVYRIDVSYLAKHTLFRPPLGWILRYLGGIPIDRSAPHGVVQQVADRITAAERILVAVPPEGTRSRRDYWKSGFYWIALTAQVPLMCGFLDYARKRAGIGLCFVPTGDISADMDRLRDFYRPIQGKYPEQTSTMRLRDEDAASAPSEDEPAP